MIFKWLGKYPYFQDKYARARILQADFMAQQIIEISDTQVLAITKTTHEDGSFEITESDALGHRRLQVDARKWAASKLAPKKYGDKLDVTSEGEKIGKTIIINP